MTELMPYLANSEREKIRIPGWPRWTLRLRAFLWVRLTRLFAYELLRDLYAGIFERPVDAAGVAAYIVAPGGLRDRRAVIHNLLHSSEFQDKAFGLFAPGLARSLYRGILGRDASPEELEAFARQLTNWGNVEGAVTGLVRSHDFQRECSAFPSPGLAQALYRGTLGRDASPEELVTFTRQAIEKGKLEEAVARLVNSDEAQRRCFALLAPEIVRALYGWILGREADAKGLKIYSERLAAQYKLDGVMSELFQSNEYRRRSFATLSRPLLEALYRGALKRNLDPIGWDTYRPVLVQAADVAPVLSKLIGSHEFRRNYTAAESIAHSRAHSTASEGACWVFLHIAKTGGTSIQHLLAASFPPDKLYREHDDTLYQKAPANLLPYSVFAGHFNFDSLPYIPRKSLSLLTFVREPIDRLCSYYHFVRAHEPGNLMYAKFHRAANELDLESFFQNDEIKLSVDVWNQMTWAIMGATQWQAWQLQLLASADPASTRDFIDALARPAIRRRLREFSFIGLQEDFNASARMLCDLLAVPRPEVIPAKNRLADLMQSGVGYKKELIPEPITPARRQLLESLVQLDQVVYEEAKLIYSEQIGSQRRSPAFPDSLSSANPPIPLPKPNNLTPRIADNGASMPRVALS